jgi:phospholipid N-methyltransferase
MPDQNYIGTATYSPEDNKLRLTPFHRLDKEDYERVKAAGFKWAPRQELFVAPMWTPDREDLLVELCGEIGDEDTSLVERAEQRADRFTDYSANRRRDAERAHGAVKAIADNIPLGQPILVGHHSERHARRDAEKIENGMRRAVKAWETAEYWKYRAAGAIAAAKYKELPAVRARRIKTLEAEQRKWIRNREEAADRLAKWQACAAEPDQEKRMVAALAIANHCYLHLPRKEGDRPDFSQTPDVYTALTNHYPNLYAPRTLEEVLEHALSPNVYPKSIARYERWIAHYENRLTYERAMLNEAGGTAADKFDVQVGGRVLIRNEWMLVLRVNRKDGRINSVTTNCAFVAVRGIEEVKDYRPPEAHEAEAVKRVMKTKPLCNYPGEGFLHMTKAEWEKTVPKWSDFPKIAQVGSTDTAGAHRVRQTRKPGGEYYTRVAVYLTDQKRVDPPAPAERVKLERKFAAPPSPPAAETIPAPAETKPAESETAPAADFEAMRQSLKAGVQVVTAPQLFPTPAALAERMAEIAGIEPHHRCLEPSAGTGVLLEKMVVSVPAVAVEINGTLAAGLKAKYAGCDVHQGDFMEMSMADLRGPFDRILMNPPFANGQDVEHVRHAFEMLKPGGRLVAVMCEGPFFRSDRKSEAFRGWLAEQDHTAEELPADTFESSGTSVRTRLVVMDKPEACTCATCEEDLQEPLSEPLLVSYGSTVIHRTPAPPPLAGEADPEFLTRLEAERYTLEFNSPLQRPLDAGRRPFLESPLFGEQGQENLF